MWSIWLWSEISSRKDFEILWKFVIFQIFIFTVLNNLHSTECIPRSTEASPTCTAVIPYSTEAIPPRYWIPSTILMLSLHTTVIPHWTEQPPQYWCYPLLYWTISNVLNILHSIKAYPPQYWCYPPLYWTSSNLLNNLHSTEPTLYGVKSDILSTGWSFGIKAHSLRVSWYNLNFRNFEHHLFTFKFSFSKRFGHNLVSLGLIFKKLGKFQNFVYGVR